MTNDPMNHPSLQALSTAQKEALLQYNALKKSLAAKQDEVLHQYRAIGSLHPMAESHQLVAYEQRLKQLESLNQSQQKILQTVMQAYHRLDDACKKVLDILSAPHDPTPGSTLRKPGR